MKFLLNISITFISLFLSSSCTNTRNQDNKQKNAITKAEAFIRDNGYTSLKPDTSKLSFELFDELENDISSVLKSRHNTLQPKAFCISRQEGYYNVGFLSTEVDINKLTAQQKNSDLRGRAVRVSDKGIISIVHQDPLFSKFTKLK